MRQLLVLAGGLGSRLGVETESLPKILVPISDDCTMFDLICDRFHENFDDIVFLLGHLAHKVEEHITKTSRNLKNVRLLVEPERLGTAGPLYYHRAELEEEFYVINGDTIFDCDLTSLERTQNKDSVAVVGLFETGGQSRFGNVVLDRDMKISAFHEKANSASLGFVNAGAYYFKKTVLDFIPGGSYSAENELFPRLVKERLLEGRVFTEGFLDIGVPETLKIARKKRF